MGLWWMVRRYNVSHVQRGASVGIVLATVLTVLITLYVFWNPTTVLRTVTSVASEVVAIPIILHVGGRLISNPDSEAGTSTGVTLIWQSLSGRAQHANGDTAAPVDRTGEYAPNDDVDFKGATRHQAVNASLEKGNNLRAKARDLHEEGEYDHALETYDKARAAYAKARETAREGDLDTDEVDQKLAAVENQRRATRRESLRAEVASVYDALDRAATLIEDGDDDAALEELTALEPSPATVSEEAAEHDFEEIYEAIDELDQVRQDLLTEVTDPAGPRSAGPAPGSTGLGPPDFDGIPTAPEVSVDYESLTNKERIGSGGNADVMKANFPTEGGDIALAIKRPRIPGTLHIETVERLLEEAETWAKLDKHDHIVAVVDYGNDPMPWIAMEYMDGGHLGQRCNDIEMQQALWTSIAVTKGVRHAHRRGVAHLDLKPENILFRTVDGAWDVPKVADWGLSKHLLEHSQSVEGFSPQYAAPEQFSDEYGPTDDVTDIYQLGGVFYELFTGLPPFEGGPAEVMREVLDEPPRPPSEVADVPEALDDILLTALAKERADRYESVLYFRDALQNLYDDW